MNYEKPVAILLDDLAEGVYAASGATGGDGSDAAVCQSLYMNGVPRTPIHSVQGGEYRRIDRGCEGCPALQYDGACRLDLGPFGDPLMPHWEREGHGPDDAFIYRG